MRIISIDVGSYTTAKYMVEVGDTYLHMTMTEEEKQQVISLVAGFFHAHQKEIAKEIETARPLMIELQPEAPAPERDPSEDLPF